jgi:hypothetical protein
MDHCDAQKLVKQLENAALKVMIAEHPDIPQYFLIFNLFFTSSMDNLSQLVTQEDYLASTCSALRIIAMLWLWIPPALPARRRLLGLPQEHLDDLLGYQD